MFPLAIRAGLSGVRVPSPALFVLPTFGISALSAVRAAAANPDINRLQAGRR